MSPPPVKYQDMDEFMASSKILTGPPFLFDVRTDYVKVTNDTVIVPITIQVKNSDITFETKDGVSVGKVDIEGRVSNMTHKVVPGGWFGDAVEVSAPSELLPAKQKASSVYWKALPLKPGLYKIDIVIKDTNNPDHVGRWTRSINVPKFDDDTLGHSSLILADQMERGPSKEIGGGNFVIGNTRIRPRVAANRPVAAPVSFSRAQNLNFWMQVYNLGIDEKSKQNNATINYQILDLGTNKLVLNAQEPSSALAQCGPVDAGEEPSAGQLAAGTVPGEDQGERWSDQTGDRGVGKVYRELRSGLHAAGPKRRSRRALGGSRLRTDAGPLRRNGCADGLR